MSVQTKQPFTVLQAAAVPLRQENIDTDQVIPARFLKGTSKTGLGASLFYDLRFDNAEQPVPGFPLNQPQYQGANILLAGDNFGCGSSREHAPWALTDYGFKAIIAPSFADIFKNNALKNQLLPVALPVSVVESLMQAVELNPSLTITVDLPNQQVTAPGLEPVLFDIESFRKQCLLEGLDDIGYTLQHADKITAYEAVLN